MADAQPQPTDLNADLIPLLNPHFRLQWEPAQNAYVLLYPEGMVKLNSSSGEILSRCDGRARIRDVVDELQRKFPAAQDIEQDILEFFTIAFARRWLTHG